MDAAQQVAGNRDHYDRITEGWRLILGEDLHWGVFREPGDDLRTATERLSELMADFAHAPARDARVLDVGCGVGGPAEWLARRFGWRVTGISVSPVGIAAARAKAAASDVRDKLEFRLGDAMDLDFADASFDVVWVMESPHLMPDKARLVRECARVVKPGGTVALCDLMLDAPLSWRRLHELRDDLMQLEKSFGVAQLETLDRYRAWFEEAGLRDVETLDVGALVVPTIDAWEANIRAKGDRLDACFGEDLTREFLASCGILRRLYTDGEWGYGIVRGRR